LRRRLFMGSRWEERDDMAAAKEEVDDSRAENAKREKVYSKRERSGPGGGSRTHTGSDPRQILSLLRLPVPPLRENCIENSMRGQAGKVRGRGSCAGESARPE